MSSCFNLTTPPLDVRVGPQVITDPAFLVTRYVYLGLRLWECVSGSKTLMYVCLGLRPWVRVSGSQTLGTCVWVSDLGYVCLGLRPWVRVSGSQT